MGTVTNPNQFRVRACDGPACSIRATGPRFTLLPVDDGAVDSGLLARIGFNGKWKIEPSTELTADRCATRAPLGTRRS